VPLVALEAIGCIHEHPPLVPRGLVDFLRDRVPNTVCLLAKRSDDADRAGELVACQSQQFIDDRLPLGVADRSAARDGFRICRNVSPLQTTRFPTAMNLIGHDDEGLAVEGRVAVTGDARVASMMLPQLEPPRQPLSAYGQMKGGGSPIAETHKFRVQEL